MPSPMQLDSATTMYQRNYWVEIAGKLATPVLAHLANRTLRSNMPVEEKADAGRGKWTHLEAFGRVLAGIAPWLELGEAESRRFTELAREGLDAATDPSSPDFMNFDDGEQALVDSAFLSQGLLRAPTALWEPLPSRVKTNVLNALRAARIHRPVYNNHICFSAMNETALCVFGATDWDRVRIEFAFQQQEQWYLGDGHYADGPRYHADYYNSFVMHPILVDMIRHVGQQDYWARFVDLFWNRSIRYAAVLERLISPEGTIPPLGRALTYRCAALQTLGQMALLKRLPEAISPAQVREAMTAVIRRMMDAPGTFDEAGWLKIGFCGAQPGVGESYISTGSLYLCAVGLLPLGLSDNDPFWSDPPAPWTSVKAWGGRDFPIDRAQA